MSFMQEKIRFAYHISHEKLTWPFEKEKNRLILYRKLNKTQGDWLTTAKLCMYEWMYVCMYVRTYVRDGQSGK